MSKFNIGSKVIVRDGSEDDGRTGVIIGYGSMYPWRIQYDDNDSENELFRENELELIQELQRLTKEEALCLCIHGTKIVNEFHEGLWHIYWNGSEFRSTNGIDDELANYVIDGADEDSWGIYEPPKPKPKFSVDDFVMDKSDKAYMRISKVIIDGSDISYEVTSYADESGDVFRDESQLAKI